MNLHEQMERAILDLRCAEQDLAVANAHSLNVEYDVLTERIEFYEALILTLAGLADADERETASRPVPDRPNADLLDDWMNG